MNDHLSEHCYEGHHAYCQEPAECDCGCHDSGLFWHLVTMATAPGVCDATNTAGEVLLALDCLSQDEVDILDRLVACRNQVDGIAGSSEVAS